MKKIKSIIQQVLLGIFIGLVLGGIMLVVFDDEFFLNFGLDTLIYFIVMLIVSFILQLFLHEAGHMVFGYVAKFKFVSFRMGSYILTIEEGKLKLGRYRLANTAGQCLMEPSTPNYWYYLFYNLGGGLFNLAFALVFLMFGIINHDLLFDIFCFSMLSLGLFLGLSNLIPLDVGVPNDGYNAYWMSREKESMYSLYQQLMISKELADGKRMNEIKQDYFELYEHANLKNPLNLCIEVNKASFLVYQGHYEEAKELLERLNKDKMSEVFKNSIIHDLVLIELLISDEINVDQYLDEKHKKMLRNNKSDVSSLLDQYGIDLLVDKDEEQALITLKYLKDACKTYPYQGLVKGILELQKKIEERVV